VDLFQNRYFNTQNFGGTDCGEGQRVLWQSNMAHEIGLGRNVSEAPEEPSAAQSYCCYPAELKMAGKCFCIFTSWCC